MIGLKKLQRKIKATTSVKTRKTICKKPSRAAKKKTSSATKKKHVSSKVKSIKAASQITRKKIKVQKEVPKPSKPQPDKRLKSLLGNAYARQLLVELAGENALEVVMGFTGEINDEELAKRLKLKVSDVRATLNKLHSDGLVSYSREKDNESGWYSYHWRVNSEKIEKWVYDKLNSTKSMLHPCEDGKEDRYFCSKCGMESIVGFETALDYSFRCPVCNSNMEFFDAEKIGGIPEGKKPMIPPRR